jgi:hypothetical protein
MVSIESGDIDPTAATLRSKRRGPKAKQLASMNGNHNDYHEGHDHLGMARSTDQESYEELSAKLSSKELEAARIQEVRNTSTVSVSFCSAGAYHDNYCDRPLASAKFKKLRINICRLSITLPLRPRCMDADQLHGSIRGRSSRTSRVLVQS